MTISKYKGTEHETIINIQLLRFFAAFIVTFGHAQLHVASRGFAGPAFSAFDPFDFRAGVDIFFVISGFVMYYVSSTNFARAGYPTHFLGRRFIRILPLYWTTTGAMLLVVLLAPSFVQHPLLSWEQVVCSFFFLPYSPPSKGYPFPLVGVGWTLNYEMFFYFCFFFVLMLRRTVGLTLLATVFGLAAFLHVLFLPHTYVRFLSEWTDPVILEFLFGIGLAVIFEKGFRWPKSVGWLIALFGLSFLTATPQLSEYDIGPYRPAILGIPSLIICAGLALSDSRYTSLTTRRSLCFGGNISYALYLSHEFTFNAASIVWRTTKISAPWFLIAGLCISCVGVSAIIYRYFELPITAWLKTSASRLNRAAPAA